jgi:iron(III) transport system ATP-binding protein
MESDRFPGIPGQPAGLSLEDIEVRFGAQQVLQRLSVRLSPGEIGCLLGPSGCGKTTALRVVAGFVRPDAGRVSIGGRTVADHAHWIAPEHRQVGIVFQDHALFPHLNVAENVAFGLRHGPRPWSAKEREARVKEVLTLVQLPGLDKRFPHELSGGQQQRVALARALAPRPGLLLLDEPFSNLDPDLRESLAMELRDMLKAAGTTALLVTHDQYEAFALADCVGVMEQGYVAQWDSAYRLYHQPDSRSVADFVGMGSFLPATLHLERDDPVIETEIGWLSLQDPEDLERAKRSTDAHGQLDILLRPDDVVHDDSSRQLAVVRRKAFRGAEFLYTLALPSGQEVLALVPSHHNHALGEPIGIRLDADHVVTFARPRA